MSAVLSSPQAPVRPAPAGFLRRLFRDKPLGAAGGVIFVLFLLCGIFADVIAPHGMNDISPLSRLKPPSLEHPFGTDNLGRDMLSRCLYGAQLSVIIGLSAAALATVISVVIGIVTGYLGGKVDMVAQRFVDAWMSFPDLIILIVIVSVLGPGMPQIIGTLGMLLGIAGSRIIRSAVGGMNVLRTSSRAIRSKAASGSNLSQARATTGTPKCRAGNMTLSKPPAQAQSAGVHSRSPGRGRNSCGNCTPGRCPSTTRCPCNAPFGWPVVPDV